MPFPANRFTVRTVNPINAAASPAEIHTTDGDDDTPTRRRPDTTSSADNTPNTPADTGTPAIRRRCTSTDMISRTSPANAGDTTTVSADNNGNDDT